jgi:hypothetical protein
MKQIQPVSIWYNGSNIPATLFLLVSNSDNLSTTANFYFALYSSSEIKLTEGNIIMTGFDYDAYTSSPDSNAYAYQWAATQLNLTLV